MHRTSRRAGTAASRRASTTCSPTRPSSWCRSRSEARVQIAELAAEYTSAIGISIGLLRSGAVVLRDMRKTAAYIYHGCGGLRISMHPGPCQCCSRIVRWAITIRCSHLCHASAYTTNAAAAIQPPLLQTMSMWPAYSILLDLAKGHTGGAMGCNLYSSAA